MIAGGLLLLWVAWKMLREAQKHSSVEDIKAHSAAPPKTFRQAVGQVVMADVAMSLDNVLGVAGAAQEHFWVLVFGLTLSVFLMGAASNGLANILQKHRWMVFFGIGVVFLVALQMIWKGGMQVYFA